MRILLLLFVLFIPYQIAGASVQTAALIQPYLGAPACPTHNDRQFHKLWDYGRGCHYDHEHGDNPHTADSIFGTNYYTIAGGEISYPWQTPNENSSKHNSYKWIVRTNLPCVNDAYITSPGCITDFRAQVHADMFNMVSDYHSFAVEMRLCLIADPSNCGIFRFGGWQFSGDMTIDGQKVVDRVEPPGLPTNQRIEQIHAASTDDPRNASWYVISPGPMQVRVVHRTQDNWGFYPLPATQPLTMSLTLDSYQFFCEPSAPSCTANGSKRMPDLVGVQPGPARATIDADGNFVADYQGYVDRYGAFVTGCTGISLDCIPVSFEHVPLPWGAWWVWLVPFTDTVQPREYDISFNGAGSNWIRFPNLIRFLLPSVFVYGIWGQSIDESIH